MNIFFCTPHHSFHITPHEFCLFLMCSLLTKPVCPSCHCHIKVREVRILIGCIKTTDRTRSALNKNIQIISPLDLTLWQQWFFKYINAVIWNTGWFPFNLSGYSGQVRHNRAKLASVVDTSKTLGISNTREEFSVWDTIPYLHRQHVNSCLADKLPIFRAQS